ncbi:putative acetylcholine receptor subunit alpha-like [Apostichopus japonicus]|uniref:Putative acetylcholine receptor subunit alpha-like n=1 Tax=Stichopus japonicus TaxID=307972 RepID=A0A2G8K5P7_STIJA|nr:putative acetylcholine receptor subunit alpha-like [Apostichopus japonicus]
MGKRWLMYKNKASADTYKPYMDGKVVVVKHNGAINWASPAIFYSHCRISVTHFPFDQQQCELKFGPWQHDGSEVILHGRGECHEDFVINEKRQPEGIEWNCCLLIAKLKSPFD